MHDAVILILKGLAGGLLVVAFALLSEILTPKRFAGLFAAAPSVAIAGLAITLLDKGSHEAHDATVGMIAGAVGMAVYGVAVVRLMRRLRASRAAAAGVLIWAAVASVVALPLLLG